MSGSLSEWQAGREAEASTDRARAFHRLYLRLRIDDQLHYYQERRTEYATAHRQAVVLRTALVLGAAAAGVVTLSTAGTARAAPNSSAVRRTTACRCAVAYSVRRSW